MQLYILTALLTVLVTFSVAAAPQKAIVVSYEDPNTPQSVIDEAMAAIKEAGGVITHEYSMVPRHHENFFANNRSVV